VHLALRECSLYLEHGAPPLNVIEQRGAFDGFSLGHVCWLTSAGILLFLTADFVYLYRLRLILRRPTVNALAPRELFLSDSDYK
jgi:hypothetical protein